MQTQTERDQDGMRARKERERMHAIPDELPDEITGQHEGEELQRLRSRRATPERISRLEEKHDQLAVAVGRVGEAVAEMRGEMSILPRLVDALEKSAHVSLTARVDVDKARAMEPIEAGKWRRDRVTQVVTGVLALATAALAALQASRC
jgi:hypothetical protein